MKFLKYLFLATTLIIGALTGPACDSTSVTDLFFTDQDDIKLGDSVVTQLANDTAYKLLTTANSEAIKSYIKDSVISEILKSSEIHKKDIYNYTSKLQIIQNDSVLNAFALPGGPIYIYTGILKYLPNEAALAGVLGHEIAHAELRHASSRMVKEMGIHTLLSIVLGQSPGELTNIAAGLFTGLALLQNSRSDEDDADLYSFKYLSGSKYYPGSVKFFFEKMIDEKLISSKSSRIETFLSTHPDPEARISSTEKRVKDAGIDIISYKDETKFYLYTKEYNDKIILKLP